MKILIVSQYFAPEKFRINDLAVGLKGKGHEVTVLTGIPNYPSGKIFPGYSFWGKEENYQGVVVKRVPLIPRGKAGKIGLSLNYLSFVVSAGILAPFYCREKFDVIFVCALSPITVALPAILLKRIKHIPLFLWILDLWPESLSATNAVKSTAILKLVDKLVRFIYNQTDSILVSSKGFIPSVKSRGAPIEKISFFPNWAEDAYRPIRREDVKLPISEKNLPSGFKLVFAGNVGVAQDFLTILSAFELLKDYKDIHLLILGEGRMLDWVKTEIEKRELASQVHWLGSYPSEVMPDFFSIADALLVTLRKDPLFACTLPGKIQNYLACGKPIVAALDGEGARLIDSAEAGFSCSSGDPQALKAVILRMYQVPVSVREQMGRRALAYCQQYFQRERLLSQCDFLIKSKLAKGLEKG